MAQDGGGASAECPTVQRGNAARPLAARPLCTLSFLTLNAGVYESSDAEILELLRAVDYYRAGDGSDDSLAACSLNEPMMNRMRDNQRARNLRRHIRRRPPRRRSSRPGRCERQRQRIAGVLRIVHPASSAALVYRGPTRR